MRSNHVVSIGLRADEVRCVRLGCYIRVDQQEALFPLNSLKTFAVRFALP